MNAAGPDLVILQKKLEEQAAQDAAGLAAASAPLPGPLREAFSPIQDVQVGPYKFGPFYDAHFEHLTLLDHPVAKLMSNVESDFTARGPQLWQLAWILSVPIKVVDDLFRSGGVQAVKDEAARVFGQITAYEARSIFDAVAKQLEVYWSPTLGYGPAKSGEGSEAAKAPSNPQLSGQPPTGSAG